MPVVTGDVKRIAGTTVTSGEVRFTATTPVVQDPNGNTTSLATSVAEHVVTIDGTGSFSTTLPATGETWVYRVEISAYVDGNRVQGLPRLLLEVPATGADLSDAGVEGAPSGRVVINRMVGAYELSAALAPIRATADNAVAIAEGAVDTLDTITGPWETRLDALETLGGLAPGDTSDATVANLLTQEDTQTHAAAVDSVVTPAISAIDAKKLDKTEAAATYARQDETVLSTGVREFVRTSDPAVVESAPADTVVFFEGRPGVETDFMFGVQDEIIPVWAEPASWTAPGSVVRRSGASANGYSGAVPRSMSGQYRDVDVVARVRYQGFSQPGVRSGIFILGNGSGATPSFLTMHIQGSATDGDPNSGLRLNAIIDGVGSKIPPLANKTYKNDSWRNQDGIWYYYRLRFVKDVLMARQWVASDPEPTAWDLMMTDADLPAAFRSAGWASHGLIGFHGHNSATAHECDYFAAAFNGASAPLKATA